MEANKRSGAIEYRDERPAGIPECSCKRIPVGGDVMRSAFDGDQGIRNPFFPDEAATRGASDGSNAGSHAEYPPFGNRFPNRPRRTESAVRERQLAD